MIELIAMQCDTKAFRVDDYLKSHGRIISDALDVVFIIKERQSTTDADATIVKNFGNNGVTADESYIYVHFTEDDYAAGKLQKSEKYVYGLGFKYADLKMLLEPKITNVDGNMANYMNILPNYVNN